MDSVAWTLVGSSIRARCSGADVIVATVARVT